MPAGGEVGAAPASPRYSDIHEDKWWRQPLSRREEILCLLATLWVIARLVSYNTLNTFYSIGAQSDAHMFSTAMWHGGWLLQFASQGMHAGDAGPSFFTMHLAPILWLPDVLSYIFPIDRIPLFSWFLGSLHAALGLAIWLLLQALWPSRHWAVVLLRCLAAIAFALNANSQSILFQGHPEIAGPAFTLIFLWALFRGSQGLAAAAFVLALLQREDMGFHLFGLLFLLLALDMLRGVPEQRFKPVLIYALSAFGYSVAAMLIQKHFFGGGGGSMFLREYVGNPPYAHVTKELLLHRIKNFFLFRYWIWGPGFIALLWAIAARNPYLVVGWLAFVPWLVISLLASLLQAAEFQLHYGYPFIISGAWPLLAVSRAFMDSRGLRPVNMRILPAWVVVLLMIQQPTHLYHYIGFKLIWMNFLPLPELHMKAAYDEFERRLPAALPQIGTVRADQGVFNIAPYALLRLKHGIDIWDDDNYWQGGDHDEKIDGVFYFSGSPMWTYIVDIIKKNKLDNHYQIPGTNLFFSTSRKLEDIGAFRGLFFPVPELPMEAGSSIVRN